MSYYLKKYKRYKRHYICFNCRKGFKQPNEKDIAEREGELSLLLNAFYFRPKKKKISKDIVKYLSDKYFDREVLCPECSKKMFEVSMSFKVPPKKKIREWKIIESNFKATGYIHRNLPKKRKDLIQYFKCALDWHIYLLQHQSTKTLYQTEAEVKERQRRNIENIKVEIKKLKKEL